MWTIVRSKCLEKLERRIGQLEHECKQLNDLVFKRVHKEDMVIHIDRQLNQRVDLREAVQMIMHHLGVKIKYVPRTEPKYIIEDTKGRD